MKHNKFIADNGGGVTGLTSATGGDAIGDNEIIRGDGTTGIQGSDIQILDSAGSPSALTLKNVNDSGTPRLELGGGYLYVTGGLIYIGSSAATVNACFRDNVNRATLASDWDFGWSSSSTNVIDNAPDAGFSRTTTSVVRVTDGTSASASGWLQTVGFKRKTADQTVTNSTTLVDDSHLTVSLQAGRSYAFRFRLHHTDVATGGFNFVLGGTATHTALISCGKIFDTTSTLILSNTFNTTTLATHSYAVSIGGLGWTEIEGTTTVNAAGTFLIRFAQQTETGAAETITAHRGSTLEVWDIA